jgi:hypothetical protein
VSALYRYLDIAKNFSQEDTSHIKVILKDGLLTIESVIQDNLARYTVDMNCGSMPVEFLSVNAEKRGTHWKCCLQNVDGIWIPEETMMITDLSDGTREWTRYHWKKNVLNKPIDQSVFSLDSLGLHRGTRVYDYRTDEEYIISDNKYPPFPDQTAVPKRHTWFNNVFMAIGLVMIVIAFLLKYLKWRSKLRRDAL